MKKLVALLLAVLPMSACDIDLDGQANVIDVQKAVNAALGAPCILPEGCTVVQVQGAVNGVLRNHCEMPVFLWNAETGKIGLTRRVTVTWVDAGFSYFQWLRVFLVEQTPESFAMEWPNLTVWRTATGH
jgi:hypothetical protein